MNESFDPTILIFAVLAVFVIWKLRSVLGTRTGEEKPPTNPFQSQPGSRQQAGAEVLPFPTAASTSSKPTLEEGDRWRGYAEAGTPLWANLDALAAADPEFEAGSFVDGAKAAYELVVSAFAKGDRSTLRRLLSAEVFESFDAAITTRESRGESAESTFVAMNSATLEDAQVRQSNAQVTVRFNASLINATRDRDGNVVDGDPEKVVDHVDVWTFARDVRSKDPNWKLIATESST